MVAGRCELEKQEHSRTSAYNYSNTTHYWRHSLNKHVLIFIYINIGLLITHVYVQTLSTKYKIQLPHSPILPSSTYSNCSLITTILILASSLCDSEFFGPWGLLNFTPPSPIIAHTPLSYNQCPCKKVCTRLIFQDRKQFSFHVFILPSNLNKTAFCHIHFQLQI